MNVLMIWEDHPDDLRCYLLKDISSDEWDLLNLCSSKFLGQEIDKKSEKALEKVLIWTTDYNDKEARWIDKKINLPYSTTCSVDVIIHCGIIM